MRSLTEQQLLNAQVEVMARAHGPKLAMGGLPLKPVVDGNVIQNCRSMLLLAARQTMWQS